MTKTHKPAAGRTYWPNVVTVLSAAILIAVEVFGAAFAGGWAIANLFQLGEQVGMILQGLFFLMGLAVMVQFVRNARKVEPFSAD